MHRDARTLATMTASVAELRDKLADEAAARQRAESQISSYVDQCATVEHENKCLTQREVGLQQELQAEGLLATAVQHEIDHLDGKLIVDFMSKLRREMVIRKFRKIART